MIYSKGTLPKFCENAKTKTKKKQTNQKNKILKKMETLWLEFSDKYNSTTDCVGVLLLTSFVFINGF